MNARHDPSDESLRTLLRAMEQERERLAPPFQRVWQRARRAAEQGETNAGAACAWPRFAALAGILTLAAAFLWWNRSYTDAPEWEAQLAVFEEELDMLPLPNTAPEIGVWELPTDFLLAGADDKNPNPIHP
jgi:hypothetical protein